MSGVIEFLIRHGHVVLFVVILVDQLGLPFPAAPFLLAAGALAHKGGLSTALLVALAFLACIIAHAFWYEAGRRGGAKILRLVCRVSLEPDACVRRTEDLFAKYGIKSIIISRFVPGFDTVSIPLAAMSKMSLATFIIFDLLGIALWTLSFLGVGYLFSEQLTDALDIAARLGTSLAAIAGALLAFYLAVKFQQRRRVMRDLRIARIHPAELKRKIDAQETLTVVDLRAARDFDTDPRAIPGALRIDTNELDTLHHLIPRDREIILYCT